MSLMVAAPAKINLWLRVGDRDETGFHPLDTLFCRLDLADMVGLRTDGAAPGIRLHTGFAPPLDAPPELGPDLENLAVRAAGAFYRAAGIRARLDIRLTKRIPVGGGLGGGSSDAAAVLRGLHRLHPGALPSHRLLELAAELGSDVPFLATGHALARGHGRGERLTPLAPLPSRPVVLVLPPLSIATGPAYDWLDQDRAGTHEPGTAAALRTDRPPAWDDVVEHAVNDFEAPVFQRHPALATLRTALREHGARPALLAGSGSTLFGVFASKDEADAAATALRGRDPALRLVVTRTRTR